MADYTYAWAIAVETAGPFHQPFKKMLTISGKPSKRRRKRDDVDAIGLVNYLFRHFEVVVLKEGSEAFNTLARSHFWRGLGSNV